DISQILDEIKAEGLEVVYVGESVAKQHSDFLSIPSIVADMQEQASEQVGDFADGYLNDFTQEHSGAFKQVILDYFNTNITQPAFYSVKSVREVSVEEFYETCNKEQQ
ncbi:unnamed protein product, partial [marine sediment metagenome]